MTDTLARPQTGSGADTRGIIPILLLSAFVLILNETTMSVAVPQIMIGFAVDATTAQWLTTGFLLTMAVVIPLSGYLLQRLTTRTVFFLSLGLFITGTTACLLAPVFEVLLAGRVIQASGTAVMMPLLMTTVLTLVPVERRGRVMGNISVVIAVAPALGPTASGLIQEVLGWRGVFGLVLPIAVTMLVAGALRLKNFGEPGAAPLDVLSVILSAFGFGGLVYALASIGEGGEDGGSGLSPLVPLVVGVVSLTLFVLRQIALQRRERPLLDLRTLRSRPFVVGVVVMMVSFGALLGTGILLPIYLQELRGLSAAQTGLFVMPGGVMMGVLGPLVGRLYDRVGPRVLAVPGLSLLAGLMFVMSRIANLETPIWQLVLVYTAIAIGLGFTFTPTMTAALNSLSPQRYSHGSALLSTMQQVGGAAGTALLVTLMSLRWATLEESGTETAIAQVSGIDFAFFVAFLLAAGVAVLALLLPGRPPKADPEVTEDIPGDEATDPQQTAAGDGREATRPTAAGDGDASGDVERGDETVTSTPRRRGRG